ncbi:MAG: bifunctional helix-turn-helix domain-containing protein/methylated-DNA--[protein]-cysteine S-methyltransferase [Bacteroidetes bacterium]|nr:bifunctional helix-turn-helix domain-containing protein/methylated-DNA--[protein]-cysteine S-methyltransferase [Bacteroidota bacterium]MCH8524684.1 bifunctional helix-turn-helix domain-containing protein/methylated-DNA--[protein]-cysteine S-methyltransferase [Balneolales bacterium]
MHRLAMVNKYKFAHILPSLEYIASTFPTHPNADILAEVTGIHPQIFQRIFVACLGVTVKEYIQHLVFLRARLSLRNTSSPFSESAPKYDKAIPVIRSSALPRNLVYHTIETKLGSVLIAADEHGIATVLFVDEKTDHLCNKELDALLVKKIQHYYPTAICEPGYTDEISSVIERFAGNEQYPITLHLNCTSFQLDVYRALAQIPRAQLRSYSELARYMGKSGAARAVGTAVGKNPVALIIPCHRIVPLKNTFGNYMWGNGRKTALLVQEAIQEKDFL